MATTLTEIVFEPEHYSRNCGCTIPEAYVGIVQIDDPLSPINHTKIMGETRADVIAAAEREGFIVEL